MAKWNIEPGDRHLATFVTQGIARFITVSGGRTAVYVLGDFEELPSAAELSGRLILADRVHGRLTEVKVNGRTFPVCFELDDEQGGRGVVREPNGSADTAKVFSTVYVRAVRKFE
jgi:serine/threonine-protein kinase